MRWALFLAALCHLIVLQQWGHAFFRHSFAAKAWGGTDTPIEVIPKQTNQADAVASRGEESASEIPRFMTLSPQAIVEFGNELPEYPERARREGTQGTVWVELLAEEGGSHVELLRSSGSGILDDAIVSAASRWRLPSRFAGVKVRVPFRFELE